MFGLSYGVAAAHAFPHANDALNYAPEQAVQPWIER
jgi:hypothetical protein